MSRCGLRWGGAAGRAEECTDSGARRRTTRRGSHPDDASVERGGLLATQKGGRRRDREVAACIGEGRRAEGPTAKTQRGQR